MKKLFLRAIFPWDKREIFNFYCSAFLKRYFFSNFAETKILISEIYKRLGFLQNYQEFERSLSLSQKRNFGLIS